MFGADEVPDISEKLRNLVGSDRHQVESNEIRPESESNAGRLTVYGPGFK
jgi:hypothetical protein